jgi:hypothetical protein
LIPALTGSASDTSQAGLSVYIFTIYIKVLSSFRQIDICHLPALDACGVKRPQGAQIVGAALPESASVAVQKSASFMPRAGHADF